MILSNQSATSGLSATATASGPSVAWREKIGSSPKATAIPLATVGYEVAATIHGSEGGFSLDPLTGIVSAVSGQRDASGTITYGNPVNGDTISVNGSIFTKASTGGSDSFSSRDELIGLISQNGALYISGVSPEIVVHAQELGSIGNSFTLSQTGSGFTLSGPTLTGGFDTPTIEGGTGLDIDGSPIPNLANVNAIFVSVTNGSVSVNRSDSSEFDNLSAGGSIMVASPLGSVRPFPITLISHADNSEVHITVMGYPFTTI